MSKGRLSHIMSEQEAEEKVRMQTIEYYDALKFDFAKKSVIACSPSHALAIGRIFLNLNPKLSRK